MGNAVVHFELNGPDAEAAGAFYSELFGWHVQSIPEMGYGMIDTHAGSGINGGFGQTEDGGTQSTIYVEVNDLDATLAKASGLGGKTLTPPTEIPDVVTFATFADPEGNVIGIVKGGDGEGPGVSAGSNPGVGWFEIYGKDPQALWRFYSELFGWAIKESTGEGYVYGEVDTQSDKGGIGGGIANSQDGRPRVVVWAAVDDLIKYLERAESLGAKKTMDPQSVGENLVVAMLADPQGRPFGLFKYGG